MDRFLKNQMIVVVGGASGIGMSNDVKTVLDLFRLNGGWTAQ